MFLRKLMFWAVAVALVATGLLILLSPSKERRPTRVVDGESAGSSSVLVAPRLATEDSATVRSEIAVQDDLAGTHLGKVRWAPTLPNIPLGGMSGAAVAEQFHGAAWSDLSKRFEEFGMLKQFDVVYGSDRSLGDVDVILTPAYLYDAFERVNPPSELTPSVIARSARVNPYASGAVAQLVVRQVATITGQAGLAWPEDDARIRRLMDDLGSRVSDLLCPIYDQLSTEVQRLFIREIGLVSPYTLPNCGVLSIGPVSPPWTSQHDELFSRDDAARWVRSFSASSSHSNWSLFIKWSVDFRDDPSCGELITQIYGAEELAMMDIKGTAASIVSIMAW